MPATDSSFKYISLLNTRIAAVAVWGARDVAGPWRQRFEDRIELVDGRLVSADHHAITAFNAPDAAGRADIEIVDPACLQRLAAANVVLPKTVAAIYDDVALFHQRGQRVDGRFRDLACGQHHPGGPRLRQLRDKILQGLRPGRAVRGERFDGRFVLVVNDGRMSMFHQSADDVAAHPTQADHANLHVLRS